MFLLLRPDIFPKRLGVTGFESSGQNGLQKVSFCPLKIKRKFTVTFIIADVRRPILGADFLRRHKLLVDLSGQKLIEAHSFQSYACAATNNDLCVSPVATVDSNHYKQCLLQQYPELLRPTFHAARPSHDVSHYITTVPMQNTSSRDSFG